MSKNDGTAFRLREARDADVPALAALHVNTFNETHRGGHSGGPSYELREQQWREVFERQDGSWFCYVIEDDRGELVGFAKGTPHDGGVAGYAGELNKIYLLHRVQRRGLGRLLLCAVARRFVEQGVTSMLPSSKERQQQVQRILRSVWCGTADEQGRRVSRRLRLARPAQPDHSMQRLTRRRPGCLLSCRRLRPSLLQRG